MKKTVVEKRDSIGAMRDKKREKEIEKAFPYLQQFCFLYWKEAAKMFIPVNVRYADGDVISIYDYEGYCSFLEDLCLFDDELFLFYKHHYKDITLALEHVYNMNKFDEEGISLREFRKKDIDKLFGDDEIIGCGWVISILDDAKNHGECIKKTPSRDPADYGLVYYSSIMR